MARIIGTYRETAVSSVRLTKREIEILELVNRGCSNKEISELLNIRLQTVKNHLSNIFEKLEVNRRFSAARFLTQLGLTQREKASCAPKAMSPLETGCRHAGPQRTCWDYRH
ncbi:MAG: response regulator transcription factor [Chloroflexi bacterium]|nr:response regulator transcription factor [Chloroflexota bacterium]